MGWTRAVYVSLNVSERHGNSADPEAPSKKRAVATPQQAARALPAEEEKASEEGDGGCTEPNWRNSDWHAFLVNKPSTCDLLSEQASDSPATAKACENPTEDEPAPEQQAKAGGKRKRPAATLFLVIAAFKKPANPVPMAPEPQPSKEPPAPVAKAKAKGKAPKAKAVNADAAVPAPEEVAAAKQQLEAETKKDDEEAERLEMERLAAKEEERKRHHAKYMRFYRSLEGLLTLLVHGSLEALSLFLYRSEDAPGNPKNGRPCQGVQCQSRNNVIC